PQRHGDTEKSLFQILNLKSFLAFSVSLCLCGESLVNSLPNLAALCSYHRVARFAPERLRERRHVRERTVDAEFCHRMRVRLRPQARGFRSYVLRPDLRPAQKETLLRRKTVNVFGARLAL